VKKVLFSKSTILEINLTCILSVSIGHSGKMCVNAALAPHTGIHCGRYSIM
jgi:hypothetical protein